MKTTIKTLAKSKLSGYLAFLFYLGFLGGAFINMWLAIGSLCLSIIAICVSLYFEIAFTWRALNDK